MKRSLEKHKSKSGYDDWLTEKKRKEEDDKKLTNEDYDKMLDNFEKAERELMYRIESGEHIEEEYPQRSLNEKIETIENNLPTNLNEKLDRLEKKLKLIKNITI